jgi:hypothetical protein
MGLLASNRLTSSFADFRYLLFCLLLLQGDGDLAGDFFFLRPKAFGEDFLRLYYRFLPVKGS